jgi:Mn2+/Fe2+ NRAMP family transporter
VKGIWSIIISIPVIIFVFFYRNPQAIITYTGGFCGVFILFLFPVFLWHSAKKKNIEETHGFNFNRSSFQSYGWLVAILIFALCTLASAFYTVVTYTPGNGES